MLNNELEFIDAYRKQNDIFDKDKLKEAVKSAKEIYESILKIAPINRISRLETVTKLNLQAIKLIDRKIEEHKKS